MCLLCGGKHSYLAGEEEEWEEYYGDRGTLLTFVPTHSSRYIFRVSHNTLDTISQSSEMLILDNERNNWPLKVFFINLIGI